MKRLMANHKQKKAILIALAAPLMFSPAPLMAVTGTSEELFFAPAAGKVMPVTKSADEAFAAKAMGDGIAVDPADGTICAPCDGTVSMIFPTGHAVGLTTDQGTEVLIHVGIDTVKMDGDGFEALVKQGDRVAAGDVLIRADLDKIRAAGYNPQTMMIFPELENASVKVFEAENAKVGDKAAAVVR